jgi:hypothetical protein
MIDWVMTSHPDDNVQNALSTPYIVPVPEDDPQRNPPENREAVKFISKRYTPEEELEAVVKSVKGLVDSVWDFPDYEKPTIAILVPRNHAHRSHRRAQTPRRGSHRVDLVHGEYARGGGIVELFIVVSGRPTVCAEVVEGV